MHHMVIYICDDDFDDAALGKANECFHPQLPKVIDKCGLKPVLMAWAMGVTVSYQLAGQKIKAALR